MKHKFGWLQRLPVMLGIVFSVSIMLGIYLLPQQFQKPPHLKKVVQQLTMIQPPPPPPITEQTPQEPELKQEMLDAAQPEKEPEPAPVSEPVDEPPLGELGLDADGAPGSDGFGLAARKGGRSILGGAGGSALLWYGGQLKNRLEDALQNALTDTPAMHSDYKVIIEVWVDAQGRMSRCELTSGSGKDEVDQAIRKTLVKLTIDIGKPPPENMPQPVKILVISRG